MGEQITTVRTFGDARQLMLQTIIQIRDGGLDVQQGMAIAACMKTINDNIQCEINAAKLSLSSGDAAHKFGEVVHMGRKLIGQSATDYQGQQES